MEAINKTLDVLELFPDYKTEMSLGDIVRASGLKKTTIYRIVSTLVKRGYLKQQKRRGKYSLGIRFHDLAGRINNSFDDRHGVIPYMIEINKILNESIHLSFWNGTNILFSRSPNFSNESSKKYPPEWLFLPLHCTAEGKLILSDMSEEDLKKYLSINTPEKNTPNTIIDIDRLKEHLLSVKREGIACDLGERNSEMYSIAAGIKDHDGENIGAIVVAGPTIRLTSDSLNIIKPTLKLCALKISEELGYKH